MFILLILSALAVSNSVWLTKWLQILPCVQHDLWNFFIISDSVSICSIELSFANQTVTKFYPCFQRDSQNAFRADSVSTCSVKVYGTLLCFAVQSSKLFPMF